MFHGTVSSCFVAMSGSVEEKKAREKNREKEQAKKSRGKSKGKSREKKRYLTGKG